MKNTSFILKIAAVICVFSIILSALSACSTKTTQQTVAALSDTMTVTIAGADEAKNEEILTAINEAVKNTEKSISSTDKDSELSVLNSEKHVYASDYFMKLIGVCLIIGETTEKAANITLGDVYDLWGFSTDTPCVPDEAELRKAVAGIGLSKIELSLYNSKISIPDNLSVDLSAAENGIICDNIYDEIKLFNTPFMLNLGGTVLAGGQGPSDGRWKIEIKNPDTDSVFATLRLAPDRELNMLAVSTAEIRTDSFTENGTVYHRFLAPSTGYPVETDLVSVTVTAASAHNADALADACFLTGFNESTLRYLSYFGAEAVFIFNDGTYYVTDGLSDSIKIKDKDFTLRSLDITTD